MEQTVGRFMTRDVLRAAPDEPLRDALARMDRAGIHHLLVVDPGAVDGELTLADTLHLDAVLGIVSTRDLLGSLRPGASGLGLEGRAVGDVMTPAPLLVTSPATPLAEAGRVLAEARVGALPVVEAGGALVGILTGEDVVTGVALEASAASTRST